MRRDFKFCPKACIHSYYCCLKPHRAVQGAEGSIQDALAALDQFVAFARPNLDVPAGFEEETENGDVQFRYSLLSYIS